MIQLRPEDSIHKSFMNRLLIEVIDQPILSQQLAFKGGTCAAMLGFLDRFSVDLDFDAVGDADPKTLRAAFRTVFQNQGLSIIKEHKKALLFQVRYSSDPGKRNSMKVSANTTRGNANQYKVQYFAEIDRLMNAQAIETIVANKLVAVTDRYRAYHTIAGRDIYDIHHFLTHGYSFTDQVIRERTGLSSSEYCKKLVAFIKKYVTQIIINEDLNTLLPNDHFQHIRKILIPETLTLLTAELKRTE